MAALMRKSPVSNRELGMRAYKALQRLQEARRLDNSTARYQHEDRLNEALEELWERVKPST